jgi:hypothetical protein
MSSTEGSPPASDTTEVTILTGDSYRVEGRAKDVERIILDAARGSLMELAWLIEAETGEELAFNPEHVVIIRAVDA